MARKLEKIVVAMSGGVDSSVSAALLKEQGYEVVGLFMCTGQDHSAVAAAELADDDPRPSEERQRGCCRPEDAADARIVAGKLGIPFYSLNFSRQFEQIIDYFADEYLLGRTPNPCVLCNQHLKFGLLAEYGQTIQAPYIATGHYARIGQDGQRYWLRRAIDANKDQSYVLFGIERAMLPRILFPVGELTKEEVRRHAERLGLPISDKPDSQDICFAPDRDYARIVGRRRPGAFVEGAIVDNQGREVGRHRGIAHFTIGQRRGLDVAMGEPYYVTHLDPATNTVTIGPAEDLLADRLRASKVNWLVDPPADPFRAVVKIRYAHAGAPAAVRPLSADCVEVHFDEPVRAITPGQAAVFYDGDFVLGGGWIE
ncbi:MAG: tRNA 2-thiouridine(34) synthase MnmA [Phycisphaerales bacterium]|nr:tRNA 2-thiouridine(34) synthase MnmA [Phycisphaerales bacterium]